MKSISRGNTNGNRGVKLGLVSKLMIAIILGVLIGQFMPSWFCHVVVTASGLFSTFLKFVIPLTIVAYVTMGIADLSQGAGKLLIITVALACGSTLPHMKNRREHYGIYQCI